MVHTKEFIERLRKRMTENNPVRNPNILKKIKKGWFKKGQHSSPDTEFKKGDKGHLGYTHSKETKKHLSKVRIGKFKGTANATWKGDKVGYYALHAWVGREKGKASICEFDSIHKGPFEWANVSKEYKRDLNDYMSLCKPCHARYDGQGLNRERDSIGRWKD